MPHIIVIDDYHKYEKYMINYPTLQNSKELRSDNKHHEIYFRALLIAVYGKAEERLLKGLGEQKSNSMFNISEQEILTSEFIKAGILVDETVKNLCVSIKKNRLNASISLAMLRSQMTNESDNTLEQIRNIFKELIDNIVRENFSKSSLPFR